MSRIRACSHRERLGVDQQVRLRDDVEADRADALADRVGELVMVAEQVQPRPHRRQHFVDHRLAGVDAPARPDRTGAALRASGTGRCSCSALHASTSSRTKCRRLSSRLLPSFSDAADVLRPRDGGSAAAGVWYQLGANVPPSAATRHGPTLYGAAVRQVVQRRRRRLARHRRRDHVEVLVVALDPVERRAAARSTRRRCSRRRRPAPRAARRGAAP